jgi:hypothetical protein
MIDIIKNLTGPVAKAVAAFLTPLVLMLVAWLATKLGVDLAVDPEDVSAWINTVVVSLVSALTVYLARNQTPQTSEPPA